MECLCAFPNTLVAGAIHMYMQRVDLHMNTNNNLSDVSHETHSNKLKASP